NRHSHTARTKPVAASSFIGRKSIAFQVQRMDMKNLFLESNSLNKQHVVGHGQNGGPIRRDLQDDPELEAIRQRRMQELMAQRGMGSQSNPEQQKAQEEAKSEAEERRQMMLSQILSMQARERHLLYSSLIFGQLDGIPVKLCFAISWHGVARIALVKPEKARGVEDVILRAAQMGQIVEKVSEEKLITLLEQINNQTTKQTKVTIQRRRSVLEDDD
ncbi:Programmed cell death protein 5, partial [Cucurbita argyrosperma subsp. sororia]